MLLSVVSVFAFTLFIFSCFAKVTLDVPSSVCLGSVVKVTCITNGTNILGWRYNLIERYYHDFNQLTDASVLVGPFTIQLTCVRGSEFTSVATVNVSSNLNGTVLECADNDFSLSNTNKKNFTFSVNESTNITFLDVNAISCDQIYTYWSKAKCISYYRLTIDGQQHNLQTNSMIYKPNTNKILQLSVIGFDFSNNSINKVSETYCFGRYNFTLIVKETVNRTGDNMTYADVIVIIEPADVKQPPLLLCLVTLTNKADPSKFEESDCTQQSLTVKFDVTPGANYTVQVNVTNIIGSTQMKKNISIPTTPVQIIINGTVTSTITTTERIPVPTISTGIVIPLEIGISIAAVLIVHIVIFVIIIIILSIIIYKKRVRQLQ